MHRRYQRKFSFYILLSLLLVGLCCAVPTELFPGPRYKKNETMTLAALGDCIIARKISVLKDPGFLRLVNLVRRADCTWANCEVNLVEPNAGYPEKGRCQAKVLHPVRFASLHASPCLRG